MNPVVKGLCIVSALWPWILESKGLENLISLLNPNKYKRARDSAFHPLSNKSTLSLYSHPQIPI